MAYLATISAPLYPEKDILSDLLSANKTEAAKTFKLG